jgi:TRAP-type C4-dicarboxylate transport system substrate-binding protein
MRTNTAGRGTRAALLAGALSLAVVGCGGASADKAGGRHEAKPTVLTMANGNSETSELEPFAAAVARLSGGTLRVEFKNSWRADSPDYGPGVIRDVRAGKADLAWAGSRVFDRLGVQSFDALHAPLLVDSYPLERRVLESSLAGEMLAGLQPLDVVGLGILPGPLRKPLGVSPLVRPEDYRGKTIAYARSAVTEQTLHALGARGAEIASSGAIDSYDGVEQGVTAIDGNRYDKVARYLTANVTLWPRPVVLFMNAKASAALSGRQRTALRDAVRAAIPATLALHDQGERESAGILCRRGVALVTADRADLAAMRSAVQPVYDRLERRSETKAAIARIQAMRSGAGLEPDAPTCSNSRSAPSTGKVTAIDGLYRVHTTAEDLRAAGASGADLIPENYGRGEMVLDRGRFTQGPQQHSKGKPAVGTFTVTGDTLTMTFTSDVRNRPGERFDFRWSLYRDRLTLKPVKGRVSPVPMLAKPWRRIGDAR